MNRLGNCHQHAALRAASRLCYAAGRRNRAIAVDYRPAFKPQPTAARRLLRLTPRRLMRKEFWLRIQDPALLKHPRTVPPPPFSPRPRRQCEAPVPARFVAKMWFDLARHRRRMNADASEPPMRLPPNYTIGDPPFRRPLPSRENFTLAFGLAPRPAARRRRTASGSADSSVPAFLQCFSCCRCWFRHRRDEWFER